MKDVATPVPQNEVRAVIKKSLENAALVNYERLSEEARIEGESIHNNNDGSVGNAKIRILEVEQGFSSFFPPKCPYLMIFQSFAAPNLRNIWGKMKNKLVQLAINPLMEPEFQVTIPDSSLS